MSDGVSGFARALAALGTAGVDFVVVGVGGINFYARTPADAFATLDIDAFLAPAVENLRIALSTLAATGYEFEAGGEPFVDLDDALVLRRIVENGASLSAIHTESSEMDLCQPPCRVQPTTVTSTLLRLGGRGAERRLRR